MNYNKRPPKTKRKSNLLGKLIGFLLILILIGGGGALIIGKSTYEKGLNEPHSTITDEVSFEIEQGSDMDTIIAGLIDANLLDVKKEWIFTLYLKQSGLGTSIQAGRYRIPQNLNVVELVDTLQEAGIPDIWITVTEGLRIDEIADILNNSYSQHEESVFDRAEFIRLTEDPTFMSQYGLQNLTTLEGYLYPDKYLLPLEATSEYVLATLINTFFAKVPSETTYDDLIIASMIEREARTEKDRGMVSDIIRRRLSEGWFLGIDATNLYYHEDWKHVLTYQDLQLNHPYNTRNRIGLPPTPICNPSLSSINASLTPISNQYYYYISADDGTFYYAKTGGQHEQNIANYLR